jgi:beta-xylosidase
VRLFFLFLLFLYGQIFAGNRNACTIIIEEDTPEKNKYHNPVILKSSPDPTVIKAKDGYFYLYSTEDTRNIPIYKSCNLVEWRFVGTAFNDSTHPNFMRRGRLWAPDVNYVKGRYVMYYALSKWGEHFENGIGVAVANSPGGPFVDKGKIFLSKEIGVKNSIDPFFIKDNGRNYLFWGSFHGIYGIELSKDGLHIKKNAKKQKVAGRFMEATAVEKKDGFYYLFGSAGSCCKGVESKYHITYGRSKSLFGPYVTKEGKSLMENNYETLIMGNERVAGPGHQSRLMKDKKGDTWIIYHGYLKNKPKLKRVVFLDKVKWVDGWPEVKNCEPSYKSDYPLFK